MHICFAARISDRSRGGVFRVIEAISEGLRAKGHRVDLVLRRGPARWPDFLVFPFALFLKSLRTPWDVVVAHSSDGTVCSVARRLSGRFPPVIAHCHGWEERAFETWKQSAKFGVQGPGRLNRFLATGLRFPWLRLCCRYAQCVIFVSPVDRAWVAAHYVRWNPRLRYIPNGVADSMLTDRAGPEADRKTDVLFVGNWTWKKGNLFLQPILRELFHRCPALSVALAGLGISASGKERLVCDFPGDRITFHENASMDRMKELYTRAKILVHPSLFEGGCPSLAILEAMACGAALVAFSYAGLAGFLEQGRDAVLVKPGDWQGMAQETADLLHQPEKRRALADSAAKKARGFTWERIVNEWEKMLLEINPPTGIPGKGAVE